MSPTRPHLRPEHVIVRQPVNGPRILGQCGNFLGNLYLFGPAVLDHRRADWRGSVRTHPHAGARRDHRDHEGGGWPRPASGVGSHWPIL